MIEQTDRPTVEEAEAYLALAEKATAGPWEWKAKGGCVCHVDFGWVTSRSMPILYDRSDDQVNADALLIAASRTAGPRFARAWLAAQVEIERLRVAMRDVVEEAADEADHCCGAGSGHHDRDNYGCHSLVRFVESLAETPGLDRQEEASHE